MDIKMTEAITNAMIALIARLNVIEKLLVDNHIASENWMCMVYEQEVEKINKNMEERMKGKNE